MALEIEVLETALKGIFADMQDGSKTDEWMAKQVATAIEGYVSSGEVKTDDVGAAPAGAYAGEGKGTMAIDVNDLEIKVNDLEKKLKVTFEAAYDNDDLAAHIASDIDDVCTADNTVSIISTGTVTPPLPSGLSPFDFGGPGKGKFTGVKILIEGTLKACFIAMDSMAEGGDDLFADQLAFAVDAYLTTGEIKVNLEPPSFVSGTGEGVGLS